MHVAQFSLETYKLHTKEDLSCFHIINRPTSSIYYKEALNVLLLILEVTPDIDISKTFITYLEMTTQAFPLRYIYVLPRYLLKVSHFN